MSEAARKKYFWLKLKEDFFRNKKIKKLRRIAGGDTFTIIYLKMQLLSLRHEGKLFFEGVEENFAEEIALEIDEDADNVKVTMNYLFSNGLLEEVDVDEYMLLEAVTSIGCESSSAERVRRHREKKKKALAAPEKTPELPEQNKKVLHCNAPVTNCNTEIDIEIEKEKDIEIQTDIQTDINKELEAGDQTDLTELERDRINLLRDLFVGWSVNDYQVLYISSLINDKLPMNAGDLYGRDIAIYDALSTLINKARAEDVKHIYRWLEVVIPNWNF